MTERDDERRYKVPTPVDIDAYRASLPQARGPHVRGDGETDEVRLDAVEYQNQFNRRSLSVWHVQRRLNELGHSTGSETGGYYSTQTGGAMEDFQRGCGLSATGMPDAASLARLFEGDPNVTLITEPGDDR